MGLYLVFFDEFVGYRQTTLAATVKYRELIDAFDGTVLAMVKMIADEIVTSHVWFFLNGIIGDKHGIFLSNLPDEWLDYLPELARATVFLMQTTSDGIMRDFPLHSS